MRDARRGCSCTEPDELSRNEPAGNRDHSDGDDVPGLEPRVGADQWKRRQRHAPDRAGCDHARAFIATVERRVASYKPNNTKICRQTNRNANDDDVLDAHALQQKHVEPNGMRWRFAARNTNVRAPSAETASRMRNNSATPWPFVACQPPL